MNIPKLSRCFEIYVSVALKKIENDPSLTNQQALSRATTCRFTKGQRSTILQEIKLRRPPKPKGFKPSNHRWDAKNNDKRHRASLGEDF